MINVPTATLPENVILELTMPPGAKLDHTYQSRLAAFTAATTAVTSAPPAMQQEKKGIYLNY